jgi:serine/threonine protein kinase
LAYELVYQRTPFTSNEEKQLFRNILYKNVEFPENECEVSEEFKDFVVRLTRKDPKERMELSEALNHPWFQENAKKKKKVHWMDEKVGKGTFA